MAAPLRLALFDCDGTLVGSFAAMHERALADRADEDFKQLWVHLVSL